MTGRSPADWPPEQLAAAVAAAVTEPIGPDDEAEESERMAETPADGWGSLPDLDAPPLPSFPLEQLPTTLAGPTIEIARFLQVEPAAAATFALGVLSAAARGRFMVGVRGDYAELVVLYVLLSMESGDRKSEIVRRLAEPLQAYERELKASAQPGRVQKVAERKRLEGDLKREEKRDRPDEREITRLTLAIEQCIVPPEPRLLADDCTMEKLSVLLAEQQGSLAVVAPEGSLFKITGGRYSATGAASFEPLLRGWSGEPLRVDRVTREYVLVERATLTVVMAVQPSLLREFVGHPDYRGRGLVARFLMATPRSTIGTRLDDPEPIAEPVLQQWRDRVTKVLAHAGRRDTPGELRLRDDAYTTWRAFYDETERLMADGGDLEDLRDWGSKCAGQVIRLAALLHLLEHAYADPLPVVIPAATMAQAVALGRYFRATACAVIRPEQPLHRDLRKLAGWLRRRGSRTISLREVKQSLTYQGREGDNWLEVLIEAVAVGLLRPRPPEPPGPNGGRPPGPSWQVHPHLGGR